MVSDLEGSQLCLRPAPALHSQKSLRGSQGHWDPLTFSTSEGPSDVENVPKTPHPRTMKDYRPLSFHITKTLECLNLDQLWPIVSTVLDSSSSDSSPPRESRPPSSSCFLQHLWYHQVSFAGWEADRDADWTPPGVLDYRLPDWHPTVCAPAELHVRQWGQWHWGTSGNCSFSFPLTVDITDCHMSPAEVLWWLGHSWTYQWRRWVVIKLYNSCPPHFCHIHSHSFTQHFTIF